MNTPESTLFNAVPVVSELNRVAGFDPLRFLKKTANGHELDLRYKKLWFRLKYPAGRTRLTPLRITDQLAIIEAKVFFDKDDADPASSYIATMTQENAPAGLYIQAAEHDALDMALTNAGFGVQFAPMPKADTPYAEPITPVMRSEPAPAPQAAAEQVRTEPAAVRADIEPVVVQQPEQEVVHHAEKSVPDTAPVEVSAEQPAEAVAEPAVETELPFVYDEPSAASYYYHYKAGYDLTPWCNGYRPVFDRWKYIFTADMSGVLYQRNLSDTLKDTPWAYSQLEAFSGIASFSGVATFLSAYIKRPKIEHLIKMKLYRLVSDIIYGGYSYSALQAINFNGENMRAILGIDRPYFPLLRELNPSIDQLHLIRQLLQADHKPSTEQIKWFIASKISNADAAKELLAHMSVHKLQRYVEQQFSPEDEAALKRVDYYKMNTLITDYHDYLCMCKELQYDVKNSFILFPRELKAAHDSVAKTLKDKRTAEHEKAIAGSFDEWQKRYQYQSKELMMIPPHSAKEIVDEGAALHHCVRLYVKNVAEKKSVILFVRSVDEPDKSLCTVEVKDGQVNRGKDGQALLY